MRKLCLAVLLCAVASCSAPEAPLRVGLLEWPPYGMARVADRLGYYNDGLVEFVEFQSAAEATRAFAAGGLDVVAVSVDDVTELAARNPDYRAFLIIDESAGGDAVISREPLTKLSELAGQRIGLEPSELGAHVLVRLLESAGLTTDDVELVFLDIPEQKQAYADLAIDIVVTSEPARTALLKAGGHQIFSSLDMPGEIIDVFIARDELLTRRRADLREFTKGWFKALDFAAENPAEALTLLSREMRFEPELLQLMMSGVRMISEDENYQILRGNNAAFLDAAGRYYTSHASDENRRLHDNLAKLFTDSALPERKH